ncbi:hypothetical protein SRRS_46130 [Sporomusa rhizae]|uniref:metallophosphoesterase family protein n=1 Tax=Sporomusa rhizae TaxID=357999 RepID=UPI00352AC7D8
MKAELGWEIQKPLRSYQPLNEWSKDLLQKSPISCNSFSFIVLSDSHLQTLGISPSTGQYKLNRNGRLYEKILRNIAGNIAAGKIKPNFMIHGGDAVDIGMKDNFEAFVTVTKGILGNFPVFVSLGNHDFDYPGPRSQTNHFQKYIGKIRESFLIPNTNVKLIRMCNVSFKEENREPEFNAEDLHLLPGYNMEVGYHYIVDFHVPLRLCHAPSEYNDHYLSEYQTHSFLKGINGLNKRLLGVFAHHHHGSWCCNAGNYKFPFIITACGGTNVGCHLPHYFYVTATWDEKSKVYQVQYRMYNEYGTEVKCKSPHPN